MCRMGGAQGPKWDFVEELVCGKHTSHVRCKSCGHEFHGSASCTKEHFFNAGINIIACSSPPPNLSTRLYKYASKLKAESIATNFATKCNVQVFE